MNSFLTGADAPWVWRDLPSTEWNEFLRASASVLGGYYLLIDLPCPHLYCVA